MQHHAAIARRPTFAASTLLAGKAIFDPQPIVRKLIFVEDVTVLAIELLVLVIRHLHDAVFDVKRFAKIIAQLVTLDFWRPATEVFAIKQAYPHSRRWFCV